jgi:hypothetical protein
MDTKDAIRASMDLSMTVYNGYLSDLDDSELMTRPGEGCNHLAWQMGHLINSEVNILNGICPGKGAELPEGFADAHSKETAGSDDASKFLSKDEYLSLYKKVRQSTLAALDATSDEQLSEPGPEAFRSFCPTVGHVFTLIGTHPMMHAGQIVPVRRKLNKPVMF